MTLLSHYWRDDDPVQLTAAIGADWAKVLDGLPRDAIDWACIKWLRENPKRKPSPGAIYQLAKSRLPQRVPALMADPAQKNGFEVDAEKLADRQRISKELMAQFRLVGVA